MFILTVNYLKVSTFSQSIHTKNVYTLLSIVHAFMCRYFMKLALLLHVYT
jgi:hypothetical protein